MWYYVISIGASLLIGFLGSRWGYRQGYLRGWWDNEKIHAMNDLTVFDLRQTNGGVAWHWTIAFGIGATVEYRTDTDGRGEVWFRRKDNRTSEWSRVGYMRLCLPADNRDKAKAKVLSLYLGRGLPLNDLTEK